MALRFFSTACELACLASPAALTAAAPPPLTVFHPAVLLPDDFAPVALSPVVLAALDAAPALVTNRPLAADLKVVLFQAIAIFQFEQLLYYQTKELVHSVFNLGYSNLEPLIGFEFRVTSDMDGKARPPILV